MKVLYIGGGFVGACSAAVAADSGHETLVFDIDQEKVKRLSSGDRDTIDSCIYEDGLADLLIRNRSRLTFTSNIDDVASCIDGVDAVFMCLPTPEKTDATGEADLSYYEKAVSMIGPLLAERDHGKQARRIVIVNKSTVPVAMIHHTTKLFSDAGVKNFGIVSNPEFLVEGKAIAGSIHPDRVIVGALEEADFAVMRELYRRFRDSATVKYIEVNPYEAEAGKLLANYLLFNKIVTSYDVVGRMCEYFSDVSYENVRKILTSDPRIGSWGLYDSLFAGGSCFIKDASSLAHQLEQSGTHATLVRDILESNIFQRDHFFGRAETQAKFSWEGKTVAILGAAFKQDTNDIRNSGAIAIVQQLLGAGAARVNIFDPVAMEECRKYFNQARNELYTRIHYELSEENALRDSEAVIICTDWPQFRRLGKIILETVRTPYLIMDGRRMLADQFAELQNAGFDIIAVGSPFMKRK